MYVHVHMYSEKRRSNIVAIIETHVSLIVQPKEKKEEGIATGVLPAVRLTVTLSSRELRRFRLVLLLISNECSSLVAATPYRDESMRNMRERFFRLLYLFPVESRSFSLSLLLSSCSLHLSLSIAHRASLTLSTFDNRDRRRGETVRSLVRSLGRALAHPIHCRS